ncbi:MAG: carbamoyl-phosphate synthase large subunit [Nitrospinae bacterium]|nr:carbamoyl-phosphate synthase large subunit [Nitrospinota bacterium]
MPRRDDIKRILLIGSGPIIIGQACEFDYSGTQACKALKEEGYEVILVNSNPATIMTDPEMAKRTYIEPITTDIVEKIIKKDRPDALLPTLGGQTGLNTAVSLAEKGVLDRYGVELIGAKLDAIKKAEDRKLFKETMKGIGLYVPESGSAYSMKEAMRIIQDIGFPAIIRPSFTLGGTGGNVAYNIEEFEEYVEWGLSLSPIHEILIERSVIGWKEYELEVMRDLKDNVVIICSIENLDPMGIHTGDSITVAPAQTLTDKEYQIMRNAGIRIIREIGVETGGSNIQFAVNPEDGKMVVIEMNPRVSRSSALASKATGFPIAKIAAKLAVGYTLDEIPNDITRETPASFEPTIDYCVVKFPRFSFEKFPTADKVLTTQMKSVGEVMAIGRTFKEAFQKAIRSLEIGRYGLEEISGNDRDKIRERLRVPDWERVWQIADALRGGISIDEISELTMIDPWFLYNIYEIVRLEERLRSSPLTPDILRQAKEFGFSDLRLGYLYNTTEGEIRDKRKIWGINVTFKTVDTCAAEFEAYTPYLYSTYERVCEANPSRKKKIIILGSGPNRIGQGIEFDYCCVHASFSLKEDGYETIMVNCNPETVSTDYDTSDRLYFEPLTFEDVLNIIEVEKPYGVILQFGGQTPLKLALPLEKAGVNILGTSPDNIDRAEDRHRFKELIHRLGLRQPDSDTASSFKEAKEIARIIGYPVLVRPSYVLGGRAMEIVYDEKSLAEYMTQAIEASSGHPILIDRFLEDAIEIDVDAISDGDIVVVAGIMEHIEEAGIHSGDSACSLPPYSISKELMDEIRRETRQLALELRVKGLINIQYAICGGEIFVLEVNPRASRTIPFVSKAIGVPLAKLAAKVMGGKTLKELNFTSEKEINHIAIKESIFPFIKLPGVDTILGPEMKSTGEVMGIDRELARGSDNRRLVGRNFLRGRRWRDRGFGRAFAKAQMGANGSLPIKGTAFISVKDKDKSEAVRIAEELHRLGFKIVATRGTADAISRSGISVETVLKVQEGRPHIVDHIKNGDINLVINTTFGKEAIMDSYLIRRTSLVHGIPYSTTIQGAFAIVNAIRAVQQDEITVTPLQDYYKT